MTRHFLRVSTHQDFAARKFEKRLSMNCMTSGFIFSKLQAETPISIILTSGTLNPISYLEEDLGLRFAQKLQNPHVIDPNQVLAVALK